MLRQGARVVLVVVALVPSLCRTSQELATDAFLSCGALMVRLTIRSLKMGSLPLPSGSENDQNDQNDQR